MQKIKLSFVLLIGFALAGCSHSWRYQQPVMNTFIGKFLGRNKTTVERLEDEGVKVIQIGENLTLVLPSDSFFALKTPVLNRNYYPVLNEIACLIESLNKYSVSISGYTDNRGSPIRNVALSRQQALAISNYLWDQGIDTRLLSSMGYGDAAPIASNRTAQGRKLNRRIEIQLRLYSDPDDM